MSIVVVGSGFALVCVRQCWKKHEFMNAQSMVLNGLQIPCDDLLLEKIETNYYEFRIKRRNNLHKSITILRVEQFLESNQIIGGSFKMLLDDGIDDGEVRVRVRERAEWGKGYSSKAEIEGARPLDEQSSSFHKQTGIASII